MKIRTRLFLLFLLLVGLGFYKLVDWMLADLRPRYLATMEESMVEMSTLLSSLVAARIENEVGPMNMNDLRIALTQATHRRLKANIYEMSKTNINVRVYVTDNRGMVLYDSNNGRDEGKDYSQWNDVYLTLRGRYGARATRTDPNNPDTLLIYVASPIKVNGATVGVLSVGKPADSVILFQETAKRNIVRYGLVMGVLVILMGMMFSFWITSPIEKLTVYAQAIRDGKRPPMPRLGRSEIGKLGSAFEEMRDSLEGKQYVENYVQTLTHEMKSPLSAIRGAAELMEEQMSPEQHERFLNNIRTEADRIQNLIDRLLLLSALESRKGLQNPIRVDLSELAASIAESMQPQLKTKRIQLETRIQENVTRMGERFFLRQAMINLLQNAIDFTPPGGRITVTLETRDNAVSFTVKDTGPGIPEFALTKVFDRFYSLPRPDSGLKSSGLGLTFVREVALLHGGEAHLENSSGGGARATLIVS